MDTLGRHTATQKPAPIIPAPTIPEPSSIKCDQCTFVANDVPVMIKHIRTEHSREQCHYCEHMAQDKEEIRTHVYEQHAEVVMIHNMAQHMNTLSAKATLFDAFKGEVTNMLKNILDNQNTMKQELFLIRNKQAEQTMQKPDDPPSKPKDPAPSEPATKESSTSTSSVTVISPRSLPPTSKSPRRYQSPPRVPPPMKRKPPPRILYIGDSISATADIRSLEVATQAKFVTAKAYSAVHDTVSNNAKQAAKYPTSNFTDVVQTQLGKEDYKYLILQAGSVDITNLNTKDNPEEYMEYYRQEAIMSATNIFNAGVNALKTQPTLGKVVIMKQIPRYDPTDVDPMSLKPSLSLLFNNTMTNLWMESPYKEKMFIGNHDIECNGAIRESRYRQTKSGRYDGIHLYGSSGSKAYTLSVLSILSAAHVTSSEHDFHLSCAQYKYQSRQKKGNQWHTVKPNDRKYTGRKHYQRSSAPVPIHSRFARLGDMDQGN